MAGVGGKDGRRLKEENMLIDRRMALTGLLACAASAATAAPASESARALYGPVSGEPFPVPPVNLSRIGPAFLRAQVDYATREPAGTVVIDPRHHYLYFVMGDGTAMRYGVGVGRQGFAWSGSATINSKQAWPDWYPPKEMLERQPDLMAHMSELQSGIGMHGGPRNPLGARAMYLWQNGKDTLYRIHGTTEPWTIGTNASSGCIRMINQDAIDLYNRVPVGAKVVVLGSGAPGEISIRDERPARRQAVVQEAAPPRQAVAQPPV
ncbi:MAG: L,D-transpeptidase, partial [Hyphomicrobiales bacterium]|nr:L,D-transpeptidase [Hyphomicrobiales bacterium]